MIPGSTAGVRVGIRRMIRKLEKYDLLEEIGHGGMATVYRARDTRLDRFVAVKVMHPHLQKALEAKRRFAREAKSVARLRHDHILEIYDYSGEESEESYISAELLTGPTLKQFVDERSEPLPAEIAACFTIQIAQALAAAHASGIVHRDVKPENVLLHEARCVKLTDFGIAQMVDAQSMTATGQILGSPGHMAPEQVEGHDCDERSDIFSLGTVLYFLATAQLPFTGRNPHTVLKRIMDGEFADPLRVRPSIGGELRRIIVKALSRNPDDRQQSAEELVEDLRAFVARIGIDEPERELARFLADPEGVTEELTARVVTELTVLGERAASADDVPTALDHFNRVLALDEGNERVLSSIERVGQRRSRRRGFMLFAAAALAAAGVGAIGYAATQSAGRDDPEHAALGVEPPAPDAGEPGQDAGAASADAGRVDAGSAMAAAADAGDPLRDAGEALRPIKTVPPIRTKVAPLEPVDGPRQVRFVPSPVQNVSIGVDGDAPRPFGPGWTGTTLPPGPHRFRVVPADGLGHVEVTHTRVVEAGAGVQPIALPLPYEPASVIVRVRGVGSVVPTVQVQGVGTRQGHSTVFAVPMRDEEATVSVSVTAEGFRAYTTTVRLQAGGSEEVTATLSEATGSGP